MKTDYIYEICDSSHPYDPDVPLAYFRDLLDAESALASIPDDSPYLDNPEFWFDDRKFSLVRHEEGFDKGGETLMSRKWNKFYDPASGQYKWNPQS